MCNGAKLVQDVVQVNLSSPDLRGALAADSIKTASLVHLTPMLSVNGSSASRNGPSGIDYNMN